MSDRCCCYRVGARDERPRKRVLPQKVARLANGKLVYLPPVETDDPRCPVHGISGRKLKRKLLGG